jgi:osmotically-inducible protein OsmY
MHEVWRSANAAHRGAWRGARQAGSRDRRQAGDHASCAASNAAFAAAPRLEARTRRHNDPESPMKNDTEFQHAILAALERNPVIDTDRLGITVVQGHARLTGSVETLAEQCAVDRALGGFDGSDGLVLAVEVRLAPVHRRTDAQVAHAVERALRWNSVVPHDRVRGTVDGGWVLLTGDVGCAWQRASAEESVQRVPGVRGIRNEVRVRAGPGPGNHWQQIATGLERQAQREVRACDTLEDNEAETEVAGRVERARGDPGASEWPQPAA